MKELRKKKGITLQEMGKRLGLNSYQTVARYEKGKVEPKVDRLEQIAEILDCNPGYLMGLTDSPDKYLAEIDPEVLEMVRSLMQFPKPIRDALIGIAQTMQNASNYH